MLRQLDLERVVRSNQSADVVMKRLYAMLMSYASEHGLYFVPPPSDAVHLHGVIVTVRNNVRCIQQYDIKRDRMRCRVSGWVDAV